MKKAMLLLGVCGIFGSLFAFEKGANFSGTYIRESTASLWALNEPNPLIIKQNENEILISLNIRGSNVAYEGFRLDREKVVIPGPNGAKLTIKARLKGNKFEIEKENRYSGKISRLKKTYSLSNDGKTLKMETGGIVLVYTKVDGLPGSVAHPEKTGSQAAIREPEYYAAAAVESVKKQRPDALLRFAIAGKPVVRPDCSALHARGPGRIEQSAILSKFPEAFVPVEIYRGDKLQEKAVVIFMNRQNAVQFSGQKSRRPVFSEDAMDGAEVQKVAAGLDPFFTNALDVSQGSDRFKAFLPGDIRSLFRHPDRKFRMHMPPGAVDPSWREMLSREAAYPGKGSLDGVNGWNTKLSDQELRRFVALSLDLIFQQIWLGFEGLEGDSGTRLKPALLISNPPEYMQLLEGGVSKNRQLLEASGVLTPEHLKLTSDYMKQLLGPGTIVKEVAGSEPCPCFLLPYSGEGPIYNEASELQARNKIPADARLYSFKMANLNFHFSIVDDNPRIECIALD